MLSENSRFSTPTFHHWPAPPIMAQSWGRRKVNAEGVPVSRSQVTDWLGEEGEALELSLEWVSKRHLPIQAVI